MFTDETTNYYCLSLDPLITLAMTTRLGAQMQFSRDYLRRTIQVTEIVAQYKLKAIAIKLQAMIKPKSLD